MTSRLERFSKIRPLRAILAAGGLALLLLLGVAAPVSADDYPAPPAPPGPPVTVVREELPRTGGDNTQTMLLVGAGVLVAGGALFVLGKRQQAKHAPSRS